MFKRYQAFWLKTSSSFSKRRLPKDDIIYANDLEAEKLDCLNAADIQFCISCFGTVCLSEISKKYPKQSLTEGV